MDVIESVVQLAKERDELEESVEQYEDWFAELIGKRVTLIHRRKKVTTFQEVLITEFDPDETEGWIGHDVDTDEEVQVPWFAFVSGTAYVSAAKQ
jgi:hypothetical protein